MLNLQTIWLATMFMAFLSSTVVIAFGAMLLRNGIADPSNSIVWQEFVLRILRMLPGGAIVAFGIYLLRRVFDYILAGSWPPCGG